MATVNYTDEDIHSIVAMYKELGNDGLDCIASKYNKPIKSIRAKLVHLGVYKAIQKVSIRNNGKTKKEIMRDFYNMGVDPSGLEGATKDALNRLLYILTALVNKEEVPIMKPNGLSGKIENTLFKLLDIKSN